MNIFAQPAACLMTSDYTICNSDKKISFSVCLLITIFFGLTFQPPTEDEQQKNLKTTDKRFYSPDYGHFLKSNRKHRNSKTWDLENGGKLYILFSQ